MSPPSTPRKRGDALLLAAPGDGWVSRETVIREMARFVMPGPAVRRVTARRKNAEDPRHLDPLWVGQRDIAQTALKNAVRNGTWVRDGERVRHRDHPGARALVVVEPVVEDAPEPEPVEGGFVVPPLEQMTAALVMRSAREQCTNWQWAALILTHVEVHEGRGQPESIGRNANTLSTVEFAALGVRGLKSPNTVRKFHAYALQHWGRRLEPGETITIPTMDTWPKDTGPTPGNMPPAPPKKRTAAPRAPSVRVDDTPAHIAAKFIEWHGDEAIEVLHDVLAEAQKRATGGRRRNRLKVVAP